MIEVGLGSGGLEGEITLSLVAVPNHFGVGEGCHGWFFAYLGMPKSQLLGVCVGEVGGGGIQVEEEAFFFLTLGKQLLRFYRVTAFAFEIGNEEMEGSSERHGKIGAGQLVFQLLLFLFELI